MIARLVQRTQDCTVDEDPTANREHRRNHQQRDRDAARNVVIDLGLRRQLIRTLVDEGQVIVDRPAELGVDVRGGVIEVEVVLDRHVGERLGLPLDNRIVFLERGIHCLAQCLGSLQLGRLADFLHHLEGFLHQGFGALGLFGRLLGLALLHIHQRCGKQQARAQEYGVGAVEGNSLVGIGGVDLIEFRVTGIQSHPSHAVRHEHGTREEQ
ncbi:Uncharacterised protein [Achromobacter ruhlandii]|nr:Uncharacterised protein [Achromobacter ruhlandii]CUJ70962.1 Uncharacterised protein [Achromobacter ruhlandii]CUK23558.1 Uncharacterised protein [Achromobacter ruhlandii]